MTEVQSEKSKEIIQSAYKIPQGTVWTDDRGVAGLVISYGGKRKTAIGREKQEFIHAFSELINREYIRAVNDPSKISGVTYELTLKGWSYGDRLIARK